MEFLPSTASADRTDEQLVAAYRDGDDAAFAELVRRNLPIVQRFAQRYAPSAEEAEDISQEAFVKAWKKIGTFNVERRFRPWLFEIAKHTALDRLRKRTPIAFSALASDDSEARAEFVEGIADEAPLPSETFDARASALQLAYAVETLSRPQREVVRLRYNDELTFREIASELGKSLNTVKSLHLRAVAALKEKIIKKPRE